VGFLQEFLEFRQIDAGQPQLRRSVTPGSARAALRTSSSVAMHHSGIRRWDRARPAVGCLRIGWLLGYGATRNQLSDAQKEWRHLNTGVAIPFARRQDQFESPGTLRLARSPPRLPPFLIPA
jgi:hypothetical protein